MSIVIIFTMLMALGCLPQNQEIQQSTQKDQDVEEGRVDNAAEESNTDGSLPQMRSISIKYYKIWG